MRTSCNPPTPRVEFAVGIQHGDRRIALCSDAQLGPAVFLRRRRGFGGLAVKFRYVLYHTLIKRLYTAPDLVRLLYVYTTPDLRAGGQEDDVAGRVTRGIVVAGAVLAHPWLDAWVEQLK